MNKLISSGILNTHLAKVEKVSLEYTPRKFSIVKFDSDVSFAIKNLTISSESDNFQKNQN